MKVTLLYFARVKESVNYSTEEVVLPDGVSSVLAVKQWLAGRGDVWAELFDGQQVVRAAINHELVDDMAVVKAGDELAFFPPVTGG